MQQFKEYFLSIIKYALLPFAVLYGIIVWIRNAFYDAGLLTSLPFSLPIISVGNLSVGGTGKTPQIDYLIELLQNKYHVATLSRGYKRQTRGFVLATEITNARDIGDEPMQYKLKHPDLTVCVCEDRLIAIPDLLQKRPFVQAILLDDAFQHRSVKASLQILITDVNNLYSQDYILPFGRLREFRSDAKRADIIVVSKCSASFTEQEALVVKQKLKILPHQQLFFSTINYGQPYNLLNNMPVHINNCNIILVTGIANNTPLVKHLQAANNKVHTLQFPDHYYYSTSDIEDILATFNNLDASPKIILTTQKDATRLLLHKDLIQKLGLIIAVIPIAISFLFNAQHQFNSLILHHLEQYYPPFLLDEFIEHEEDQHEAI
jgi:tetraacyldisaccharide 4'-kinase